jgi:hypothetical protein
MLIFVLSLTLKDKDMATSHIIAPSHLKKFVFGGAATFTVVSEITGSRLTFKIKYPKKEIENEKGKMVKVLDRSGIMFVSVLTGNDNTSSYSYIGYIKKTNMRNEKGEIVSVPVFIHGGNKARVATDAASVKVIDKLINIIARGGYPENATLYHEGKCGCCSRVLTVPKSILTGIGPECEKKYNDEGQLVVDRKRKLQYILGKDAEWHG